MPKSLQAIGNDALQNAPKPLQRVLHGLNMQFQPESGAVSPLAGGLGPGADGMIAGVSQGSPNTVSVMKPDVFTKNADQLVTHEGVHSWQNNLPPALQAKIPADNPNDPNNYGGTARIADLVRRGGTMLDLPREQSAAALQYGQVHGNPEPYKSLANTMNAIPLSTVDMTDPNAKQINTHPRAPLPPIMNYATDTYKKGQPAPGDDPYAAFVQTGTVGGHAPDNTPVGVAQGQSNPSAAPADADPYAAYSGAQQNTDEPYSMQLLKGIPGAAKSVGKGILEGLGSDAANLTGSTRLKALTTPSGEENDVAGQKFGKGLEQAGEFLIPGLGEEKAVSKLGKFAPLGKVAYNAITGAALNKAQGGDATTGAIAGGLGSVGGQALEAAAPGVAERALGIRGKTDRAFNKDPGRAVLDEIKGLHPDTIAANARQRISDLSAQVGDAADRASTRPNALRGLLPAPLENMPLHSSPDIAGTPSRPVVLNQADRPGRLALMPPERDIPLTEQPYSGHFAPDEGLRSAPVNNNRVGEPMATPEGNPNYGYSDQMPSTEGQWTGGVLRRRAMPEGTASGMGQGQYMGAIPGEQGGPGQAQGVFIRRPNGGGAPIPSALPNPIASLAPARGIVNEAMGSAAQQNAEGAFDQLSGMGKFLNRNFLTGEQIPSNVTPRQLLDMRRGFNEEFGQWNPERKDATINTGRQAYSALSSELHNVLPDIAPLDARISSLIPVKNRAQIKALGDDTMARMLGRIGAHSGAMAGGIAGGYGGYQHGGVGGAIVGGIMGTALPELASSPQGQMFAARALNRAGALRPLTGGLLQLNRPDGQ